MSWQGGVWLNEPRVWRERTKCSRLCGTPERAGLVVRFSELRLGPPLSKALHDLT